MFGTNARQAYAADGFFRALWCDTILIVGVTCDIEIENFDANTNTEDHNVSQPIATPREPVKTASRITEIIRESLTYVTNEYITSPVIRESSGGPGLLSNLAGTRDLFTSSGQTATVSEAATWWCDIREWFWWPCEDNTVVVVAPSPVPPPPPPTPPPTPATTITYVTTPATTEVIRESPTYITNPTTVIREVVRDSGGSSINTSDFVSRVLFGNQVDATNNSIESTASGIQEGIAAAVSTGELTVSGATSLGPLTAGATTVSSLTTTAAVTFSGLGGGFLQTDSAGVISTTTITAAAVTADSLDFAQFVDAFTLDATATFNLDASGADMDFDNATLFIDSSTNMVGIGTTSPSAQLEVYGVPQLTAALTDAGVTTGMLALNGNSAAAGSGGALTFGNNQSVAAGSVGFAAIKGLLTNGGNNTAGDLAFSTRNAVADTALTERMRILANGNVGIGTTTPSTKLSVAGTVGFSALTASVGAGSLCLSASNEVVYNSGSDNCLSSTQNTKHAITPLTLDAIDILNELEPVSFIYNGTDRVRYGFIAENTASVDDILATYNADGDLTGIDDRSILSVLVRAFQEFYREVMDRFTAQDSRIEALEERISELEEKEGVSPPNDDDETADPFDLCQNLPDAQVEMPSGYSFDSDTGDCIEDEPVSNDGGETPPPPPAPILGCTDSEALNFNADATEDDDSCDYEEPIVPEEQTLSEDEVVVDEAGGDE